MFNTFYQKSNTKTPNFDETILRMNEVSTKVGLSKSQIYKLISEGDFPPSISLGDRASGFLASEVNGWIKQRICASRPNQADAKTTGGAL